MTGMFNTPGHQEFSWWSERLGEESPLQSLMDEWGQMTPPPGEAKRSELVWKLQEAVADLMQAVDAKYPTDLCRSCGR